MSPGETRCAQNPPLLGSGSRLVRTRLHQRLVGQAPKKGTMRGQVGAFQHARDVSQRGGVQMGPRITEQVVGDLLRLSRALALGSWIPLGGGIHGIGRDQSKGQHPGLL